MEPELPPPDPNEPLRIDPRVDASLSDPTAIFIGGESGSEHERVAEAILDLRPGLLFVCAPS